MLSISQPSLYFFVDNDDSLGFVQTPGWTVVSARAQAGQPIELRQDGTTKETGASPVAQLDGIGGAFTIGAYEASPSQQLYEYGYGSDIAEVVVFDKALPDAELIKIEAYLATKWGL